jgi:hypothetical protein
MIKVINNYSAIGDAMRGLGMQWATAKTTENNKQINAEMNKLEAIVKQETSERQKRVRS